MAQHVEQDGDIGGILFLAGSDDHDEQDGAEEEDEEEVGAARAQGLGRSSLCLDPQHSSRIKEEERTIRLGSEPSRVQPAANWQSQLEHLSLAERIGTEREKGIPGHNKDGSHGHKLVSDDERVPQWVMDGDKAVQDTTGRKLFMMNIYRKQTEADGPEVKPEDGQDLGDDGEAEHHVQQGEEAEQVVHGLVQRGLPPDGEEEGGGGPHGQEEEEAEGQGQPVLPGLVIREADEEEFKDRSSGIIAGRCHVKYPVEARNPESFKM
ncbi:Palmitoyltransferase Zdhhc23 [Manis pentadactyla]|nr:Palmitoyltransferase Zdhhc23 [Manis pentadactyla]